MKQTLFRSILLVWLVSVNSFAQKNENQLITSCNQGDSQSCYTLGLTYYQSNDTDKIVKGTILLNQACHLEFSPACVLLGWMHLKGEKIEVGYDQAYQYFKRACELKDGGGCDPIANIYSTNLKEKITYQELACKYGSPASCYELGNTYEKGSYVERDICKALEFYNTGCSYSLDAGCCKEHERLKEHSECREK